MRRIWHIILLCTTALHIVAQNQFPVSQFMYNNIVLNPAVTGKNEVFTFSLSHRSQWIGFEGAPSTQIIGLHWPFKNPKVAMGVTLINDEIGSRSNKSIFLNYAYRLELGNGKLSFGLKGGFTSGSFSIIDIAEGEYIFDEKSNNYFIPNFGLGLYYYTPVYYAGFSVPHIFGYMAKGENNGFSLYHSLSRYQYYLTGGYTFDLDGDIKLQPSFIAGIENKSFVPEINCNAVYKDMLTGGLSYRSKEAVVMLLAYRISYQTKIGISYDFGIGELANYHNGSFEIYLQYLLGYKVKASNPGVF